MSISSAKPVHMYIHTCVCRGTTAPPNELFSDCCLVFAESMLAVKPGEYGECGTFLKRSGRVCALKKQIFGIRNNFSDGFYARLHMDDGW